MSNIKITQQDVENSITKEEYMKMGRKTTICLLTLKNGYELTGVSGCVDPANFDIELGKKYSRENAVNKIWQLEGYRLQCQNPLLSETE